MRKELDEALVRDFPELYADRNADMRETAMCWGFCCGDGWEPIIRKLSEQIAFLARTEGVDARVFQVKEKFGELCFYVTGATQTMHACIMEAARRSMETCEECGNPGRLRRGGWWKVYCSRHAYEKRRPISDGEAKDLGVSDHLPLTESEDD